MRSSNCFMPHFTEAGKVLKHGSYCNWESVVAHAQELATSDGNHANLVKVVTYINELVGAPVQPAPHYSKLAWFARSDEEVVASPEAFHSICCTQTTPFQGVHMEACGTLREVLLSGEDIRDRFMNRLTMPPCNAAFRGERPQSFQTVRRKSSKDRDLTIFYWPFKNGLPFNQTASNIFKMQIYGDILMVQQTREPSFLARERYINYWISHYHEQYLRQSKKRDLSTFTAAEYAEMKSEMESNFQQVEQLASSSASLPGDLAKAANIPAPSGKELAALLKSKGQTPPVKKSQLAHPPKPVRMQSGVPEAEVLRAQ